MLSNGCLHLFAGDCPSKLTQVGDSCRLPQNIVPQMVEPLLNDLCVFYVALKEQKNKHSFLPAKNAIIPVVGNLPEEKFAALL